MKTCKGWPTDTKGKSASQHGQTDWSEHWITNIKNGTEVQKWDSQWCGLRWFVSLPSALIAVSL